MFNRLITKLCLKLNPDKEIISKDELNDLEKAKRDYIELYKQNMYSKQAEYITRREYDVKEYVAVEFVDRYFIQANNYDFEIIPEYEDLIKNRVASKLLDAIKENMTVKIYNVDDYGKKYEASIKVVSKTAKEEA